MNRSELIKLMLADNGGRIGNEARRRERLERMSDRRLFREASIRGLLDDDVYEDAMFGDDDLSALDAMSLASFGLSAEALRVD